MNDLRLMLDDMDFDRLAQLGRSMIPALTPEWTDHNTHDPGIMLIELMAWIADAQIYSLSRMRRDEQLAYAALLGIAPKGATPATGLVWPPPDPVDGPPGQNQLPEGTLVSPETSVTTDEREAPAFRVSESIELTSARLVRVYSLFANGSEHDWTRTNARRHATFLPFGESPTHGDRLLLDLTGRLIAKLSKTARVSVGFEVVPSDEPASPVTRPQATPMSRTRLEPARLRVSLIDRDGERPVTIARDTTDGLLRSGVVLLSIDETSRPRHDNFVLAVRSASAGFLRSPRVRVIAVNVVPVEQLEVAVDDRPVFGRSVPDQTHTLENSGLVFERAAADIRVEISEGNLLRPWSRVDDLRNSGPLDQHFMLDLARGRLTFGNGLNGAMLPAKSRLRVCYPVTSGVPGNLPAGLPWKVSGVAPAFTNSEAFVGGRQGTDLLALRTLARRDTRELRPLVSADDLETAARSFVDLGVRRAHELAIGDRLRDVRGQRVLVVVGPREGRAPTATVESTEWLDEIRTRLAPRLPLGQSLVVIPPRDVAFSVRATLVAVPNANLDTVRTKVEQMLQSRFATVAAHAVDTEWAFGRDVARHDILGWIRPIEGVASVTNVELRANGRVVPDGRITLGATALPSFVPNSGDITVERSPAGVRP